MNNLNLKNERVEEFFAEVQARPDLFQIKSLAPGSGSPISDITLIKLTDPLIVFQIRIRNAYGVWRIQVYRTWPVGSRPWLMEEIFDNLPQDYQDFFVYHLDLFR